MFLIIYLRRNGQKVWKMSCVTVKETDEEVNRIVCPLLSIFRGDMLQGDRNESERAVAVTWATLIRPLVSEVSPRTSQGTLMQ